MEPSSFGSTVLRLAAVLGLVAANAFFVAAEFALVGARRTRLGELSRAGRRRAGLALGAIQHLDRYISSTQLGITLASLALGWIGEPFVAALLAEWFDDLPRPLNVVATHGVAIGIAFALITLLHIVLGELVPKAVALLYPERVSEWVVIPLIGFTWLMALPIAALNGLANRLLRVVGVRAPSHAERVHSPEEIRMLVEQSEEGGRLAREDARLLEGVFEFTEKNAEDVMTPRTEMVTVAAGDTVERAADVALRAGRSRYPVTGESLDDIVGVVHAKDLLAALRQRPGTPVRELMRPPLFVPGTREVEDVLADMKRLKTHLAVVLDEYGGTAGLVTMEDLLEEIVGPIYDEHDRGGVGGGERVPAAPAAPVGARLLAGGGGEESGRGSELEGGGLLEGALPIAEFNAAYGANLDDSAYTTLGGLLFGELGRLPVTGDRVTVGGYTFEIAAMEGRRVKAVQVLGRGER